MSRWPRWGQRSYCPPKFRTIREQIEKVLPPLVTRQSARAAPSDEFPSLPTHDLRSTQGFGAPLTQARMAVIFDSWPRFFARKIWRRLPRS